MIFALSANQPANQNRQAELKQIIRKDKHRVVSMSGMHAVLRKIISA
jgi:hypothetical protein